VVLVLQVYRFGCPHQKVANVVKFYNFDRAWNSWDGWPISK